MLGCATLLTAISPRVFVIAGLIGLVVIAWSIVRWRAPSPAERAVLAMQAEAKHPLCAWTQAAFLIVSGELDYGHLPAAEARQMLIYWWETHGPHELRDTLDELEDSGRPDNAWDLLRFFVVVRLAVAARYMPAERGWERVHPVARRLQAAYAGWPAMAQAYVVARRQWKGIAIDGSEDDEGMHRILNNIAALRDGLWTRIQWAMDLPAISERPAQ